MKKKIIALTVTAALVSIFTAGTSFADWFYNVNLVKSDAGIGGIVISLADDGGTVVLQKYLDTGFENTGLAIALTAQSMGKAVHVYHDTGTDTITSLVLSTE